MVQAHLPKNLWGFSMMIAIILSNTLPSKKIGLRSPIEILEKSFLDVRIQKA